MTIPTRMTRGIRRPMGMAVSVSTMMTGMTGTLASSAIRAMPVRPR